MIGLAPPFPSQSSQVCSYLLALKKSQPPAIHPLQGPVSNHIQGTEGEEIHEEIHVFSFPS